ncbi:hypothetical protein BHM03_00039788 [Ensete ventricosum]|nr:hypothetical protein BHM03_00039788 [Ensete ventricosum]
MVGKVCAMFRAEAWRDVRRIQCPRWLTALIKGFERSTVRPHIAHGDYALLDPIATCCPSMAYVAYSSLPHATTWWLHVRHVILYKSLALFGSLGRTTIEPEFRYSTLRLSGSEREQHRRLARALRDHDHSANEQRLAHRVIAVIHIVHMVLVEATKLGVTLFGGRSPKTRHTEKTLLPYSHEHLSVRSVQWGKFPVRGSLVPSWSVILVVELELGNRECVELTMPLVVLIGLTAEGKRLLTPTLADYANQEVQVVNHSATYRPW